MLQQPTNGRPRWALCCNSVKYMPLPSPLSVQRDMQDSHMPNLTQTQTMLFGQPMAAFPQSTAHVFTSINEHQLWQGRGSCILSPLKVLQVFGPSWSGGASVQSATMEGPIIAEFSSLNALNYKAGPRGSKL